MSEPGTGQLFAGYQLEEVISAGEVATVFRARDPEGITVTVKVFHSGAIDENELSRRFSGVVRAATIEHPNVAREFRTGDEHGHPYIVAQYIAGPTMRGVLQERGRLAPALAAEITAQVADALDAVHASGRVHRSVTPDNILLESDLEHVHAYLSDFAMSRAPSEDGATQIGMVVGVGPYGAPEIVLGGGLDARTDVYSLGCVLFEALAGATPFPDESIESILRRTSESPPSVLSVVPELDPGWHEVLDRALATEPADRFATAGELGRAARNVAGPPPSG